MRPTLKELERLQHSGFLTSTISPRDVHALCELAREAHRLKAMRELCFDHGLWTCKVCINAK